MRNSNSHTLAKFGTMPVFLTAISTILGAILFLRFGYAVGNVGFVGTLGIIFLGHLVTIPTAMAVAEIATNQRVMGGGAYYILSRSFGFNIGGAIGISLYLSQAISVAFYIIAFGEAFEPALFWLSSFIGFEIPKMAVTLFLTTILSIVVLTKGANMGMKALYAIVAILFISLLMFFLGKTTYEPPPNFIYSQAEQPDSFFYVFTIVFPAFTGLAAGLGLSGDLKNPEKSIPNGTIWATVVGLVVYIGAAWKLSISAAPEELARNQFIMQDIALWGPIIPIGLGAASLSSALGSIMIAPRTLQAVGLDKIFPNIGINRWLSRGRKHDNEPINGSVITIVITFIFVLSGDVNFVAQIISMFFMVTYGAICMISFMEYFAADPSYRPTFKRNKWYFSLAGAILSFWLMFKMNTPYALLSIVIMSVLYYYISVNRKEKRGIQKLFKGVLFQAGRQLQVFAQRADEEDEQSSWRPFLVCISENTFKRKSAFDIVNWVSAKYGFGTYIHYIKGYLNRENGDKSKEILQKLIEDTKSIRSKVYIDTMISPSYTSAIAQVIQLKSISGRSNNTILFEYTEQEPEALHTVIENYKIIRSSDFDVCILNSTFKGYGMKRQINVWISPRDIENANLMIMLAYIILGHKDWSKGFIKIFVLYPRAELKEQKDNIQNLITSGRLPISPKNVEMIPMDAKEGVKSIILKNSVEADLSLVGFVSKDLERDENFFNGYKDFSNVLFVHAVKGKEIE